MQSFLALLTYLALTLISTMIVMVLVLAIARCASWTQRKPKPRIRPIYRKK